MMCWKEVADGLYARRNRRVLNCRTSALYGPIATPQDQSHHRCERAYSFQKVRGGRICLAVSRWLWSLLGPPRNTSVLSAMVPAIIGSFILAAMVQRHYY